MLPAAIGSICGLWQIGPESWNGSSLTPMLLGQVAGHVEPGLAHILGIENPGASANGPAAGGAVGEAQAGDRITGVEIGRAHV